jgi:hydroxymethylbilane synthase
MISSPVIIGTRASALALRQSQLVQEALSAKHPQVRFELKKIKTTGDKILDSALSDIGGKGLFTSEIENALVKKEIDLAVHSAKDLPTTLAKGIVIAAVLKREDGRDVLVSKKSKSLKELPRGSRIGTSSLRRKAMLTAIRPDLVCIEMRGNVDTRLRKLEQGEVDGLILAASGLKRLGMEKYISEFLDPQFFLPAVGQGAILIETRQEDQKTRDLLSSIHDAATWQCVLAERAFLETLQGGCQVPAGCFSQIQGDSLEIKGAIFSLDGKQQVRHVICGHVKDVESLGTSLARELLKGEGKMILDRIRNTSHAK